jgi:hypothetical protein
MMEYLRERSAALSAKELRARVGAAVSELEAALDGVDAAQAARRPPDGGWSIAQVVDHMAQSNVRSAEELRHALAGRRPPGPPVYEALTSGAASWVPWHELCRDLREANGALDEVLASAEAMTPPVSVRIPTVLVVNRASESGGFAQDVFRAELSWREYTLVQRLHLLDHRTQIRKLRG